MTKPGPVHLHRVFTCPPDKVYRAFTEGGGFHMAFRNFTTGQLRSFGGTYPELILSKRIRHFDRLSDPAMPGEIMVTMIWWQYFAAPT